MKTKNVKASAWQLMALEIALEKMLASANPASSHIESIGALLDMVRLSVGVTFKHQA